MGTSAQVHKPDQHTQKVELGGRILLPAQAASTVTALKNCGVYTVKSSSGGGANAYTIDDPAAGCEVSIIGFSATGSTLNSSDTATVTASTSVSFNDGSKNILTFNAVAEAVILKGLSATRYLIVSNVGSVAVSS